MWISELLYGICCGILLWESITDIKMKKIHITGAVTIGILGVIKWIVTHDFSIISFLSSISIGIILLVISLLTEEKLGRGDAFYLIALGVFLEFSRMICMCMISFFTVAIFGIIMMIMKKMTKKSKVPFLPFITLGFMMMY